MGQYLKDRKGIKKYDVLDGEKSLTNPFTLHRLLNRDEPCLDVGKGKIPYLIFDYVITTHEFYSSSYFKPLTKKQTNLHNEIMNLHNKGWGYTKIHRYLLKNGFEIGKSRTTVDSIIKKIKKREEFLSQTIISEIENFRVKWLKE